MNDIIADVFITCFFGFLAAFSTVLFAVVVYTAKELINDLRYRRRPA